MLEVIPVIKKPQSKMVNGIEIGNPNIIYVDNDCGDSMTKKYNYAISQINLDENEDEFVCFRHDDMVINTPFDVIEKKLSLFPKNVGVVGMIGTYNIEKSFHWWVPFREVNGAGYIKQVKLDDDKKPVEPFETYEMSDWAGEHLGLASVDGCCMFIRKKCLKEVKFDENIKNYHFYDVDYCLEAMAHRWDIATTHIDGHHYSYGGMRPEINELRNVMFEKWKNRITAFPINKYTIKKVV